LKIDKELIKACKAKDRVSQKKLYDKLLPYLNAVCRRYIFNYSDLNDCLQETFINIFRSIDKYDPSKSQFTTWAVRIAINCTLKLNSRLNETGAIEFDLELHSQRMDPEVISKLNTEDLIRFLKAMPSDHLTVFNMHVVDGFSHKEISEMLNIDIALSRKRLSRARIWLEKKTTQADIVKNEKNII